MSPVLVGGFFTTEPPGKPKVFKETSVFLSSSFLPRLQAPQIFQLESLHIELLVHSDFYKY